MQALLFLLYFPDHFLFHTIVWGMPRRQFSFSGAQGAAWLMGWVCDETLYGAALSLFDLAHPPPEKVDPLPHKRVTLNHVWSMNREILLQGTWTFHTLIWGKIFWQSEVEESFRWCSCHGSWLITFFSDMGSCSWGHTSLWKEQFM